MNYNPEGKSWAIVLAAIITAIIGPIVVWYLTSQWVPQPPVSTPQTQVGGGQPLVQQPQLMPQATDTNPTFSAPATVCGEPAFNGNLTTRDPLFLRPRGYLSGWISSDPSTVILPNGMTKVFEVQYVLIVEDLPQVQIRGVQRQAGRANTWGCWYSADLSSFITEDAMTDFCKKKAGGNVAIMYRVSSSGFQELATTATVSCP